MGRVCWLGDGGIMTSKRMGLTVLVLAVLAGAALAASVGYSHFLVLPPSGELTVRNIQDNAVWRPVLLTVVCDSSAARTLTIYRVAGDLEYPIARHTATGQSYVYEFEANYWCGVSNGVKVTVSPACTGTVEVIYE